MVDDIASTTVTALQTTPVKGLRVVAREAIELTADGVDDDRRFYLVDERARMVNGKQLAALSRSRGPTTTTRASSSCAFPTAAR